MTSDALLDELARVAGALGGAVEPAGASRLLGSIAETARRLLGARACSLALLSDDGRELVYTTASGEGEEDVTGLRMPVSRGIAGWVVQSAQPVVVSDVRNDPRFAPDVAQSTGYVPQELVAAPVVGDEGVLGVLTVLDRDAGRPGASGDLLLLQAFCEQAAIALQSTAAFRRIADLLLGALSEAAGSDSGLAQPLLEAGRQSPDDDVVQVAALLARLDGAGPDARRLALDVVSRVVEFAETRSARRPA
jgi:GAF domain-containing protein